MRTMTSRTVPSSSASWVCVMPRENGLPFSLSGFRLARSRMKLATRACTLCVDNCATRCTRLCTLNARRSRRWKASAGSVVSACSNAVLSTNKHVVGSACEQGLSSGVTKCVEHRVNLARPIRMSNRESFGHYPDLRLGTAFNGPDQSDYTL